MLFRTLGLILLPQHAIALEHYRLPRPQNRHLLLTGPSGRRRRNPAGRTALRTRRVPTLRGANALRSAPGYLPPPAHHARPCYRENYTLSLRCLPSAPAHSHDHGYLTPHLYIATRTRTCFAFHTDDLYLNVGGRAADGGWLAAVPGRSKH